MTRRSAITILIASATFCLAGYMPLWRVPEGLSRFAEVTFYDYLVELVHVVGRVNEPGDLWFYFRIRIYGYGLVVTAIVWAISLAIGHVCYLLFVRPTSPPEPPAGRCEG